MATKPDEDDGMESVPLDEDPLKTSAPHPLGQQPDQEEILDAPRKAALTTPITATEKQSKTTTTSSRPPPTLTTSSASSPQPQLPVATTEPVAEGTVFDFREIRQVQKVYQAGGFDFWTYFVTLETDYPSYTALKKTRDLITLQQGRRYKEFEWLREALVATHPGVIIPPLPGLGLEGMLEKMDTLVGMETAPNEIPALVTHRMRGLSLFLHWLAQDEQLRRSPLIQNFMALPHEELLKYQQNEWKTIRRQTKHQQLYGYDTWMYRFQRSFTGPRSLPPLIVKAKDTVTKIDTEMRLLRSNVDKLWDNIVQVAEAYIPDQAPRGYMEDDVLAGLLRVGSQINKANHIFSDKNEELFLALVVDMCFYCGLCASIKQVIATIEELTVLDEKLSSGTSASPQGPAIKESLQKITEAFTESFEQFHKLQAPLIHHMLFCFAKLTSNFDPTNFDWDGKCSPIISAIDDPDGWSTDAYC